MMVLLKLTFWNVETSSGGILYLLSTLICDTGHVQSTDPEQLNIPLSVNKRLQTKIN